MITPEQLAASGTEDGHQKAFFCWAANVLVACSPHGRNTGFAFALEFMFAVPNGGTRSPGEAAKLKSTGTKSGVPDIFVPLAVGNNNGTNFPEFFHGLFIEMKAPEHKGTKSGGFKGDTGTNQLRYHAFLRAQGYSVVVCYSWTEARDALLAYVGIK